MFSLSPEENEIIIRVFFALILGIAIGIQREKRKILENNTGFAGLRTHAIVTMGSALITSVGYLVASQEPLRLAASIMTGIGFIGAGTIIADKDKIKGLVNAATIWTAAGIGIATGLGFYTSSAIVTILTIIVLELRRFEKID